MTADALPDEWGPWLQNALRDPEFVALYAAAEAELDEQAVDEGESDG